MKERRKQKGMNEKLEKDSFLTIKLLLEKFFDSFTCTFQTNVEM